jgi:hypothetical protein
MLALNLLCDPGWPLTSDHPASASASQEFGIKATPHKVLLKNAYVGW